MPISEISRKGAKFAKRKAKVKNVCSEFANPKFKIQNPKYG